MTHHCHNITHSLMQVHLKFDGYDAALVVSGVTRLLRNVRLVSIFDGVLYMCVWETLHAVEKVSTLRPVGFEPTRFGETVGLKSTPLDHSGRSALDLEL